MATETLRFEGTDSQGNPVTKDVPVTRVDPPSSSKPRAGACVSANTDWAPFETAMGTIDVRRTYLGAISSSSTFASSAPGTGGDAAAGRESVVSFKPSTMATFGTTDTTAQNNLLNYLRSVPVGHRLTIICWHEPEDNITAGQFTLAQWRAAVVKTGQLVDQVNAEKGASSKLRNAIAYMGPWTVDSRGYSSLGVEIWTAAELATIDVVGIDPYFWNAGDPSMEQMLTKDNSGTLSTSSNSTVNRILIPLGKPIQIMEWGTTRTGRSDAQRATDITAFYTWVKSVWNPAHPSTPIEAMLYFHLDPNVDANHRDLWKVITFPQAQAALRSIYDDMRAP